MKRLSQISLCLALLFLFSCSVLVPAAEAFTVTVRTTVVQTADNAYLAKPGESKSIVAEVKMMLKSLGYMNYYGQPSTYYSTVATLAVFYFQKNNGLAATGMLDRNTYNAILTKYKSKTGTGIKPTPAPAPAPAPTPTPTPTPAPAPTPTPTPAPAALTVDEKMMYDLINQERAKAGLKPLEIDMRLVESARAKSRDMIANNYFSHTSPTWGGFSVIIRQFAGNDYSYLGENLAGAPSVSGAHSNLMKSDGHRKNILGYNYTHIGIGIVDGGPYGKMFTQHFAGK